MVTLAGGQFRSISRWEVLTKLATLIASCVLSVKHFPLLHFFSRAGKAANFWPCLAPCLEEPARHL